MGEAMPLGERRERLEEWVVLLLLLLEDEDDDGYESGNDGEDEDPYEVTRPENLIKTL